MAQHPDADTMKKLWDMIRGIKVAMLASEDGGHLRSRPMVASQSEFSGTLYFFTRASSHKVDEVQQSSQVCVSYADPDHQNYVSLSGTAHIERDPALIKSHWSELLRTWFPKGSDDPDIAILQVDVEQAEYLGRAFFDNGLSLRLRESHHHRPLTRTRPARESLADLKQRSA